MTNHEQFELFVSSNNKKQEKEQFSNVTHLAKRRHQNNEEFAAEFNAKHEPINQNTMKNLLKDQMDGE
ncbi:hypothetical protein QUF56_09880 [Ureibacillus composti]|nr:hypothetical protein [Ureibacillus composti]